MEPLIRIEEAGTATVIAAIDKALAPMGIVSKGQINLVSSLAVSGRNRLIELTNPATGIIRYNSPERPNYPDKRSDGSLRLRNPLARGNRGFYDRRGEEKGSLIRVSLRSRGTTKVAKLSSYPMNLWERPSKDGRPGLWLLTVKLAPMVMARAPVHAARVQKEIESTIQKEIDK